MGFLKPILKQEKIAEAGRFIRAGFSLVISEEVLEEAAKQINSDDWPNPDDVVMVQDGYEPGVANTVMVIDGNAVVKDGALYADVKVLDPNNCDLTKTIVPKCEV